MSSPKSQKRFDAENAIDFEQTNLFIQSVDDRKPLGKLVKMYADQKWFDGWNAGFPQGFILGLVCGCVIGIGLGRSR